MDCFVPLVCVSPIVKEIVVAAPDVSLGGRARRRTVSLQRDARRVEGADEQQRLVRLLPAQLYITPLREGDIHV